MTEELKSQADYFKDEPIYLRKVIEELEQENKENIHYLACMTEQRNKLKSALEEIKSIVDKFDYWSSNLSEASDLISEVKDKINEVLND